MDMLVRVLEHAWMHHAYGKKTISEQHKIQMLMLMQRQSNKIH